MENIAIILTTFLRDNLLYKTMDSIVENYTNNCTLLIADQGYNCTEKQINIDYVKSQIPCEYYRIPFDSGLSFGRNFLVNKANELGFKYCLLIADSIRFIKVYDFNPYINFLNSNKDYGIVGFGLENYNVWRGSIELIKEKCFLVDKPKGDAIFYDSVPFINVDHCSNFFLAKTDALIKSPWDNELKLMEYEDFFWRLKTNTDYKVFWTNSLIGHYTKSRTEEYKTYRNRARTQFSRLVELKYNIKRWVQCTDDFKNR